jgi:uncharacterized membrane protein YfcA
VRVTTEVWIEAMLAVAVSAWIQGAVGFGYALVSAPLLALFAPELVPGPIMLSSLVLSAASGFRERGSIDRRGVTLALAGRVPGIVVGAAALAWLSDETMNVVFGGVVLFAVFLSVCGFEVARTARTLVTTGFVSGVMGTMTSIGGPPIALVYQKSEGPELRATLNTYFAIGSALSIPALAVAGHFGGAELVHGLLLLPATALGFACSGATRRYLDEGRTRAAVLSVATLSAVAVVLKTAWS